MDVNYLGPSGIYASPYEVGGEYLGPNNENGVIGTESYLGGAATTIGTPSDAGPYRTVVQSTEYLGASNSGSLFTGPGGTYSQERSVYSRMLGDPAFLGPTPTLTGRVGGSAINYIAEGLENGGSFAGTFIPGEYIGTAGFVTNYSGAAQYSGTFVGTYVSDTEYTTDYTRNYDGGTSFANTFTGTYARDVSETFTGDSDFSADAIESFINENIDYSGDKELNDFLRINLNQYKNKNSDKKIFIKAVSEYEKIILTKDQAGKVTNYKLSAKVTFLIKSTNQQISFEEEKIINTMDDKFEETRKERIEKQNFASSISNKLILELVIN